VRAIGFSWRRVDLLHPVRCEFEHEFITDLCSGKLSTVAAVYARRDGVSGEDVWAVPSEYSIWRCDKAWELDVEGFIGPEEREGYRRDVFEVPEYNVTEGCVLARLGSEKKVSQASFDMRLIANGA
jgi:hypothetical protein